MAHTTLESIRLLARGTKVFTELCLERMEANREACEASVERGLGLATGLVPYIGYDRAAALAKEAYTTGKTIRQVARQQRVLSDDVLDKALDPWRMTKPLGTRRE